VKPYSQANHAPIVNVDGPKDLDIIPGGTVKLSVSGSSDPDGDHLSYVWWHYRDAGSFKGEAEIQSNDRDTVTVKIPADSKPGDTIHIISEVSDSGKPKLTRYARFILTVKATNPDKKGAK
jgi:hypothetical protein